MLGSDCNTNEFRLIDENGEFLGIFSKEEALKKAFDQNLDLIVISPSATPPVAKIGNYSKYSYELKKKQQQNKKKNKQIELKKLSVRFCTGDNDLLLKLKQAKNFLQEGNKVMFCMFFRKREMTKKKEGIIMINKIIQALEEMAIYDKIPEINEDDKNMNITFSPNKK